jgi:hypothetical protein
VLTSNQTRDGEPWTWSPFFDDKESFYDGLTKMLSGRDSSAFPLPEQMRRIFHPKGSGYTAYANAFLEEIRANRGSPLNATFSFDVSIFDQNIFH